MPTHTCPGLQIQIIHMVDVGVCVHLHTQMYVQILPCTLHSYLYTRASTTTHPIHPMCVHIGVYQSTHALPRSVSLSHTSTHTCRHSNAFMCMTVFTRYMCARVCGCVYKNIYMRMCILRMPFASVFCTHICLAWHIRAYEYWCCVGSLPSASLSFTHTLSLSLL